jgi:ketosteroid isomerase-like protein
VLASIVRDYPAMDLDDVIARYHRALDEFSRGDPDALKALYSEAEDVTLANPFGPARRGRQAIVEALEYASGRMRDGKVTGFDELARYMADDLATMLELEHWQSRICDNEEITPFDLRVTTTIRREDGGWKIVHRHADPIATDDPSGPLRAR